MSNTEAQLDRLGDALHSAAAADIDAAPAAEAAGAETSFWRRPGPRLGLGAAVALTAVTAGTDHHRRR